MRNGNESKADQIKKIQKAIEKYGDSDGKRTARLKELKG